MSISLMKDLAEEHLGATIVSTLVCALFIAYAFNEFARAAEVDDIKKEIVLFRAETKVTFIDNRVHEVRSQIYEVQRYLRHTDSETHIQDARRLEELNNELKDLLQERQILYTLRERLRNE